MSDGDRLEDRCGFVLEPGDLPEDVADDYEAGTDEWYEASDAVCCWREVWDGADDGRCIWHADSDDKPADALIDARTDSPERLDGASVPAVELGDAINFDCCGLQGATFEGTDLRGASFAKIDGRGVKFPDADLWDVQFPDADLQGARFLDADLWSAQFPDALLMGARFPDVDLAYSEFVDAHLRQAKFPGALLKGAQFSDADLEGAEFPDADLYRAQFPDADLKRAQFPDADLEGAEFPDADLEEAEFPDADLVGAQFPNANLQDTRFPDANLPRAQFPDAYLYRAQFPDAYLRFAEFPDANLPRAQFPNVDLREAQFPGARLRWARFPNAALWGAEFPDAYLRHAQFADANLRYAQFPDANLGDAQFPDADLSGAQFSGANLTGADLSQADAPKAIFTSAVLQRVTLAGADLRGADLTTTRLLDVHWLDVRINDETSFGSMVSEEADAKWFDGSLFAIHTRLRWWLTLVRLDADERADRRESLEDANTVYRTIERLLRENSMPRRIDTYYVRARDTRRKQAIIDGDLPRWLYLATQRWVMGYGERPWRVVATSGLVILGCAVAYPLVGGVTETSTGGGTPHYFTVPLPDVLPAWVGLPGVVETVLTSLYFSVVTFTTLGYGDLRPRTGAAQFLATFESLVGAFLLALLVYVLGRRATR